MKNINEEIKRIKELMGEHIQHNNFNQMGINSKTISMGGVIHQEQDAPPSTIETPRDLEIKAKIEINKEKEEERRKEVEERKKREDSEQINQYRDDVTKKQEERDEELEKEKEENKKKEELEARLADQRKRTT
jgi:hypothetical protein